MKYLEVKANPAGNPIKPIPIWIANSPPLTTVPIENPIAAKSIVLISFFMIFLPPFLLFCILIRIAVEKSSFFLKSFLKNFWTALICFSASFTDFFAALYSYTNENTKRFIIFENFLIFSQKKPERFTNCSGLVKIIALVYVILLFSFLVSKSTQGKYSVLDSFQEIPLFRLQYHHYKSHKSRYPLRWYPLWK